MESEAPAPRHTSTFMAALDERAIGEIYQDAEVWRNRWPTGARGEAEGFFGPESAIWDLFGDPLVSAGAIRAVILQIAEPGVAAAGLQNSHFRDDFLGRARRNYATMSEIVFGDLPAAVAASRRLHVLVAVGGAP